MNDKMDKIFEHVDYHAERETKDEWSTYGLSSREGYFLSRQSAKSARYMALLLEKADRIETQANKICGYLKILTFCAIVIAFFQVLDALS